MVLTLEVDGVPLPNFPIIRRLSEAEVVPTETIVAAADNNTSTFHAIAAATMPNMGVFLMTMDQAMNLKFNLNTQVSFNANGLVLFFGSSLTQGTPTQNIEYNNPAASQAANLTITVAGT